MVNNLNDCLAWGLFPLPFATAGLSVGRIGILAALYTVMVYPTLLPPRRSRRHRYIAS